MSLQVDCVSTESPEVCGLCDSVISKGDIFFECAASPDAEEGIVICLDCAKVLGSEYKKASS